MNKYSSNSSKGCNLEVDLEYPRELRELHNYFPLTPDKEKYVIHYENLQLYLRLGLKLKNKIHYVLRIRHRINVRLVNNEKGYLKCTAKPNYMSNKVFVLTISFSCKKEMFDFSNCTRVKIL